MEILFVKGTDELGRVGTFSFQFKLESYWNIVDLFAEIFSYGNLSRKLCARYPQSYAYGIRNLILRTHLQIIVVLDCAFHLTPAVGHKNLLSCKRAQKWNY